MGGMTKIALTAPRISNFKCPADKRQAFLWDTGAPGLGVRTTPKGKPSFVFQGTYQGESVRMTIGRFDSWTIPDAQKKARAIQRLIDEGRDPRQVQAEVVAADVAKRDALRRDVLTVGDVWPIYLTEGRKKGNEKWKPRYVEDLRKMASLGGEPKKRGAGVTTPGPIAPLLPLRLSAITPDVLIKWHEREARRGAAQAARAVQMFSGFLRWCGSEADYKEFVDAHAARDEALRRKLPPNRKTRQKNAVRRSQLMAWFQGLEALKKPVAAAYLQALILTGARREEMTNLKWTQIDFRWKYFEIHDKINPSRTLPLAPYLEQLFLSIPRAEGNPFVFPADAKSGHIEEPRSPHKTVLKNANIDHVRIHGLRNSFSNLAEAAGCPAGAISQLMGHTPGTMTEAYQERSLDELMPLMVRIERFILSEGGVKFQCSDEAGATD